MDRHLEMQVESNEDGSMIITENLPFEVKRTMVMYMKVGRQRGSHANYKCDQVFSIISGEIELILHNANGREKYHMRQNGRGIYVPALEWRVLWAKTRFACVLIHASMEFDESDYIRDYEEFEDALQQH